MKTLLLIAVLGADPHILEGKVVHIADGDTITVLDANNEKHKVRLLGIDAPEVGHGRGQPAQPYGTKSKEHLESLIDGKTVIVKWRERDQRKFILGDVNLVGEGPSVFVNREMVESGFAWHYSHFDKRKELADAEQDARRQKLGLWRDNNAKPPWEWRKLYKAATQEP